MTAAGPSGVADSSARLSALAVLGGVDRRVTAEGFQGADITAFMGGGKLDLREAKMRRARSGRRRPRDDGRLRDRRPGDVERHRRRGAVHGRIRGQDAPSGRPVGAAPARARVRDDGRTSKSRTDSMHPILARAERLATYLAAWLVVAVLLAAVLTRQGLGWVGGARAAPADLPRLRVRRACPPGTSAGATPLTATQRRVARAGVVGPRGGHRQRPLGRIDARCGSRRSSSFRLSRTSAARYAGHEPLLFAAGVLLFLLALTVHYLLLAFELAREAERRQLRTGSARARSRAAGAARAARSALSVTTASTRSAR